MSRTLLYESHFFIRTAIIVDLQPDRRHPRSRSPHPVIPEAPIVPSPPDERPALTTQPHSSLALERERDGKASQRSRVRKVSRVSDRRHAPVAPALPLQKPQVSVDKKSFWESHDGSPYASSCSSTPTWESVGASVSQGSLTSKSIVSPNQETVSDKLSVQEKKPPLQSRNTFLPVTLSNSSRDFNHQRIRIGAIHSKDSNSQMNINPNDKSIEPSNISSSVSSLPMFPMGTDESIPPKSGTESNESVKLVINSPQSCPLTISKPSSPIDTFNNELPTYFTKSDNKPLDVGRSFVQSTRGSDSLPVSIRRQYSTAEVSPGQKQKSIEDTALSGALL